MVCILLCAGYATRMYPLTENFPKPLLEIKGKAIIDYIIDDLSLCEAVKKFIVVTNHKFIKQFLKWRKTREEDIIVVDDGSTSNNNRLGAVKDIQFAIDECRIQDDIIVVAGDNLLDFSLKEFIDFSQVNGCNAIMRYFEGDNDKLKRTGVAEISENNLVIQMTEKPENPTSNWAIPPFYIFNKKSLSTIKIGIESGCKIDAPGSLMEWFVKNNKVYAYIMPGKRIDVGNLEQYYQICK